MAFNKAEFITGATTLENCPEATLPEVCMAGRSNVGKSSLINKLTNRKKLAKTSNTPGKTQQMNYYRIDDNLYLIDLPGFGYAKVPEKERQKWAENIKKYLLERPTLEMILHLVDSRHEPGQLDEDFFYWLASNEKPFSVILTKCDKLTTHKVGQSKQRVEKMLENMNIEVPVLACSTETGKGIEEIQNLILEFSKQSIH